MPRFLNPTHHWSKPLALGVVAAVATLPTIATAAAGPRIVNHAAAGVGAAPYDYWTAERMRNAQALPIPEPPPELAGRPAEEQPPLESALGTGGPGAPPIVAVLPEVEQAADLASDELDDDEEVSAAVGVPAPPEGEVPTSFGTDGCHFSGSRLNPRSIDARYPYRAIGKFFFTKPGIGDFVCSAAVLRPRVIVTAGHCVHSGNGENSGWYTNFLFCPAYRGGPSPRFGCWDWSTGIVTSTWSGGGGLFPNAADYAMFAIRDREIGGITRRIGDVTGYLGYQTLALTTNHVHLLGYPVDFSQGERMHQVASGRCYGGGSNTERYGSDMRGGSSGGPWIMDFGIPAAGQTVSSPNGPNLIVGITSYASISTLPKYQGSSIPDSRFQGVLDDLCALDTTPPANCS